MTIKTPPLHAKGIYTVTAPFALTDGVLYECMAIRAFPDLIQLGVDIFASYYDPVGLDQATYEADLTAGANIITLMSDNQPTAHLPDTYIANYPNLGTVAYKNVILSMSLGPLPDYLDLTFLQGQLAAVASDTIGVEPEVFVAVAESTTAYTQAQADALEVARQAAVTNRTTDRAKWLAVQAQLTDLQARHNALVQYCKDHNVIPA